MFSSSGSICGELIFIIQVESSRLILCVNLVSVDPTTRFEDDRVLP